MVYTFGMDITTPFLSVAQLGLVALVLALVQIYKLVFNNTRWAPLISVVMGVGLAFLAPSPTWQLTILAGLTMGCIAAGTYSGIKAVTGN